MSTNFFEQQDQARRKTGLLVFYFVLAVLAIIASVYLVVSFALVAASGEHGFAFFDPARLGVTGTATIMVILMGSLYKIAQLAAGGQTVALALGGELIDPAATGPAERRLLNVVEEMAIASGTPVPPVYILEREDGINAFAAGRAPGDAVIGITRGAVQTLTRDELQGVIGHEFSHILNGDMRLNLRLIGLLHGILLLALIGYSILRYGGRGSYSSRSSSDGEKKDGGAIIVFLIALGLLIVGWVGVFFGRLIKAAVSRQREFLADASSVQFTRNPDGLAGALKKIGGLAQGSKMVSPNAEDASHLFFGAGVPFLLSAFSTHPPIEERIRRIDPGWDGVFPEVHELERGLVPDDDDKRKKKQPRDPLGPLRQVLPGLPGVVPAIVVSGDAARVHSGQAVETIGAPQEEHVEYASAFLESLPEAVARAVREPFGARCVVYALLLDSRPEIQRLQLQILAGQAEPGTLEEVVRLAPEVNALGEAARLPLVDLALPALRNLTRDQYRTFRTILDPLFAADQRISLFEYALQRALLRHLDLHFRIRKQPTARYNAVEQLVPDVGLLISSLAYVGQDNVSDAERAFAAGAGRLGSAAGAVRLLAADQCNMESINTALDRLASATGSVKRPVIDACAATIAADGTVTVAEFELLRAISDSLDCPMPPLVVGPVD